MRNRFRVGGRPGFVEQGMLRGHVQPFLLDLPVPLRSMRASWQNPDQDFPRWKGVALGRKDRLWHSICAMQHRHALACTNLAPIRRLARATFLRLAVASFSNRGH
jgi:hypothetical protein